MEQRPPESPKLPERPQPPTRDEAPKPSSKRQWLWILLLLVCAGALYWILSHHSESSNTAAQGGAPGGAGGGGRGGRHAFAGPVTLTTTTAEKGDIGVYLDAIGTVTPVYTASIYHQVTGVITQVLYREGQVVRKGDPLVEIDPRQFEAQVTTAEGALERDSGLLAQAKMDLERSQ